MYFLTRTRIQCKDAHVVLKIAAPMKQLSQCWSVSAFEAISFFSTSPQGHVPNAIEACVSFQYLLPPAKDRRLSVHRDEVRTSHASWTYPTPCGHTLSLGYPTPLGYPTSILHPPNPYWYWHLVLATEAGGTHTTGMLSCYSFQCYTVIFRSSRVVLNTSKLCVTLNWI